MAGLKPSVNLFALLDRNDPGDKLVTDLDDANAKQDATAAAKHKKTAAPAASLTKDLLAQAYPTARDYVIRKNQLERRARAEAEAAARAKTNIGVSGGDKSAGASADSSQVQDGARRGIRYSNNYYNNGASRKQQPGMPGKFGAPQRQLPNMPLNGAPPAEGVEAPPPPSLDDTNEFPSLK
ncbi:unnamed protein product [Triticum turgidum subsp. durum]|uniref:Uncharacterized protein n=1 Tax=Triticum turgidum subsp. durum TaxID=4567 RepID=A0A9R1BV13_TRITD|nr:unnamed protein product [Triticum turgidum subsp. durum]